MANNISDQLEELLKMKHSEIITLSDDSENGEELTGLLEVANRLGALQFSNLPKPDKQWKYISLQKSPNARRMHLVKIFAWPASLLILLIAGFQTYERSIESLPGETFFPIKKLSEQARIYTVQKDPEKLAFAQIELTEKRFNETQVLLSQQDIDEGIKSKALEELTTQTKTALPLIKDAVAAKNSNPDLVKNLEKLNKKLSTLSSSTKTAKNTALASEVADESQKATTEILSMIAATPGDTTLTLESSNTAQAEGLITSFTKDHLVVEKTTFTYNPTKLIIKKVSGPGSLSDLTLNAKVKIKGTRNIDGKLEAQEITVLSVAPKIEPKPVIETPEITQPASSTNQLQTGLIIEDPRPTNP